MDFGQEDDFIDEQIAGFEDYTQGPHHNIPDVSLINQIVFGEDNQEDEYVLEEFGNQQGIELSNGPEEVFVNDLEFTEHDHDSYLNGIGYEDYQKVEYVTGSGETFPDDLEFTVHHQSMNGNYIAPQQYIAPRWNYYYTPRELYLQREVKIREKQVANLEKQVSKLNKVVEKFQNQSSKDRAMQRQAKHQYPYRMAPGSSDIQDHFETRDTHQIHEFIPFDDALRVWKDLGLRFPVPRDVSHLNLHLYLFDPNSKQHAPQTKRRLTNGYQLRRSFTGEHQGQTLSEKRKWDDYCRKLTYLQGKQEEEGLIRALSASKEETERKWKNAVRRTQLGF